MFVLDIRLQPLVVWFWKIIFVVFFVLVSIQSDRRSNQITEHSILVHAANGAFLLPSHDTIISKSMLKFGEWEESELVLFAKILSPNEHMIEVGANIGTHTVPIAKMLNEGGFVTSFEMVRGTFHFLTANLAINGIQNVFAHNYGLGDTSKTIHLGTADFEKDANIGSASLWELDIERINLNEKVLSTLLQIITIDEFFMDDKEFKCPKLLKTDAEGYDSLILKGAIKLIKYCKPVLYIENKCIALSKSLIKLISSYDYIMYWHIPPEIRPNNYFNVTLDRSSITHAVNLLAYPSGIAADEVKLDDFCVRIRSNEDLFFLHQYNLTMVYDGDPAVELSLRQDGDELSCLTFTPDLDVS